MKIVFNKRKKFEIKSNLDTFRRKGKEIEHSAINIFSFFAF